MATGLKDLDAKIGGLQQSDLVIVAGRPGMGKTALATNIAFNIAKAYEFELRPDGSRKTINGGIVGFFSLEMSAEQLATRVIAEQSGVAMLQDSARRHQRGRLPPHHRSRARYADAFRFYIDQTGGISIAQLTARARRLKRQNGLDLLVVDYLQLLSGSNAPGADNRVQELTEITTGLKALAKELDVPILALSQLSRQVESPRRQASAALRSARIRLDRAGRRRRDVRLSRGILSQEPRAARGHARTCAWMSEMERAHGRAEVIIGKQRHGPTGMVPNSPSRRRSRVSRIWRKRQVSRADVRARPRLKARLSTKIVRRVRFRRRRATAA